jgi:sugar phosphate isomerase/epimerase
MKTESFSREVSITTDMFESSFRPDLHSKLQLFADCGFECIHWCDDWHSDYLYTKAQMELYRHMVESCGLKCLDVHGAETGTAHIAAEDEGALRKFIHLLENRIEFCAAVGGDAVVVHPPTWKGGPRTSRWRLDRSFQVLERVRPLCENLGVVLAMENCHPSDEKILGRYFERYPQEFVGFCFDSGHAHINRNLGELMKFGNRLRALHLHDNKGTEDDHQPPFWGTVPWARVMHWIERSGYAKPINFEITCDPRYFEGSMEEFMDYTVLSIRKTLTLIGR